jgi:hypothetical protein
MFYQHNSWTAAPIKFGPVKDHRHTFEFYLNRHLLRRSAKWSSARYSKAFNRPGYGSLVGSFELGNQTSGRLKDDNVLIMWAITRYSGMSLEAVNISWSIGIKSVSGSLCINLFIMGPCQTSDVSNQMLSLGRGTPDAGLSRTCHQQVSGNLSLCGQRRRLIVWLFFNKSYAPFLLSWRYYTHTDRPSGLL